MNSMLPFTTVFSFTLISSTLIALSSSHWLLTWMALELNLLSFIPLMSLSSNHQETEAAIKYFLAQAAGSALFLFSALWNYFSPLTPATLITLPLFMAALMLKLGAAPLHFWFPSVMAGLKWIPCLILSTWQKIIPLAIISSIASAHSLMVQMVGALSAITGGLGGLNQSSLRPLLAYSSIGHLGWMLTISMYNLSYTLIYFIIYTMILTPLIIMLNALNMTNIRQSTSLTHSPPLTQVTLLITLLSLGGLPPLTGFISKWLVIEQMTLSPQSTVTLMMLLIGSLMNLFYYLNICFSLTLVPPLTMTTPSTASPLSTTSLPAITFFTMMAPYVAMAM